MDIRGNVKSLAMVSTRSEAVKEEPYRSTTPLMLLYKLVLAQGQLGWIRILEELWYRLLARMKQRMVGNEPV